MSGSYGTANTPLDIATQFGYLEPRTSDPTLGSEPLLWLREDLDDTNATPAEYGTLRYYGGTFVHDIPVYATGSSGSGVLEVLRLQTADGTGYIPIATESDAVHSDIAMQHSSTKHGLHAATELVPTPTARYDFEDDGDTSTATDVAGSNDATVSNASFDSDAREGSLALSFDGTGDEFTSNSAVNLYGTLGTADELSISFFAKPQKQKNNVAVAGWEQDSDNWVGMQQVDDGRMRAQVVESGNSDTTAFAQTAIGEWAHIGIVLTGSEMRLFKDGDRVDATSLSNANPSNWGSGNYQGGVFASTLLADLDFEGNLDDVRYYGDALTDEEMQAVSTVK